MVSATINAAIMTLLDFILNLTSGDAARPFNPWALLSTPVAISQLKLPTHLIPMHTRFRFAPKRELPRMNVYPGGGRYRQAGG